MITHINRTELEKAIKQHSGTELSWDTRANEYDILYFMDEFFAECSVELTQGNTYHLTINDTVWKFHSFGALTSFLPTIWTKGKGEGKTTLITQIKDLAARMEGAEETFIQGWFPELKQVQGKLREIVADYEA